MAIWENSEEITCFFGTVTSVEKTKGKEGEKKKEKKKKAESEMISEYKDNKLWQ